MSDLYLPQSNGGNFELPDKGTVQGVCAEVVDLGDVPNPYQDGKPQRMVQFVFQVDQKGSTGQRLTVSSKRMALKNHEKASLTIFLQDWLSDEFAESMKLTDLVGRPAMLKIIHVQGSKNTFANIKSIEPLAKGVPALKVENYTPRGARTAKPAAAPIARERVPF